MLSWDWLASLEGHSRGIWWAENRAGSSFMTWSKLALKDFKGALNPSPGLTTALLQVPRSVSSQNVHVLAHLSIFVHNFVVPSAYTFDP